MNVATEGGPIEVRPGDPGDPWTAGNALVGLTVLPSRRNTAPAKRLDGQPALAYVSNTMKPFAKDSRQRQTLIAELNGVFVQCRIVDCRVQIVVSDSRLV